MYTHTDIQDILQYTHHYELRTRTTSNFDIKQ